jgi:hypothetical protein
MKMDLNEVRTNGSLYIPMNRAGYTAPDRNAHLISQKSSWLKTIDFGNRFFLGALGSSLPLSAGLAYGLYSENCIEPVELYEMGLYAAGLGMASASLTSKPSEAFWRGTQFGSVAGITTVLGGARSGKAYENITYAVGITAGAFGTSCAVFKKWLIDTAETVSSYFSQFWKNKEK